jgi:NDP-sugar pyrophosphorylase family protein
MDAIIICGGMGTRVRSITHDLIPKIMIEINGKPFVEYLIETLYSQGVRKIVFAAGFKGEVLKDYIEGTRHYLSSVFPWPRLSVEIETEPLGTGGAILNILNKSGLGIHSDPFLIINGDSLIIPSEGIDSYEELYYSEVFDKNDCVMFTCYKEHDGRYGSLTLAEYNPFNGGFPEDIVGFESHVAGRSWINCGWYIVRQSLFKDYYNPICNRDSIQIYDVRKVSMEKDIFPKYLENGNVIAPLMIDEKQFLEIGDPEGLEATSRALKE